MNFMLFILFHILIFSSSVLCSRQRLSKDDKALFMDLKPVLIKHGIVDNSFKGFIDIIQNPGMKTKVKAEKPDEVEKERLKNKLLEYENGLKERQEATRAQIAKRNDDFRNSIKARVLPAQLRPGSGDESEVYEPTENELEQVGVAHAELLNFSSLNPESGTIEGEGENIMREIRSLEEDKEFNKLFVELLKAKNKELGAEKKQLRDKFIKEGLEVADLYRYIRDNAEQLIKAREDVSKLKIQDTEISRIIAKLELSVNQKNELMKALEDKFSKAKTLEAHRTSELEQTQKTESEQSEKISRLMNKASEGKETLSKLNTEERKLNTDLEKKQGLVESLRAKVSKLQETIKELEAVSKASALQVAELEKMTKERSELEALLETKNKGNSKLTEQLKLQQETSLKLEKEKINVLENNSSLETELDQMRTLLMSRIQEKVTLEKHVNAEIEAVKQLKIHKEALKKESEALEVSMKKMMVAIGTLNTTSEECKDVIIKYEGGIANKNTGILSQKAKYKVHSKKLDKLKRKIDVINSVMKQTKNEISSEEKVLEELKTKSAAIKLEKEERLEELAKHDAALKNGLSKRDETMVAIAALTETLNKLNEQKDQLELTVAMTRATFVKLEEENQEYQQMVEHQTRYNARLQEELDGIISENTELDAERKALKDLVLKNRAAIDNKVAALERSREETQRLLLAKAENDKAELELVGAAIAAKHEQVKLELEAKRIEVQTFEDESRSKEHKLRVLVEQKAMAEREETIQLKRLEVARANTFSVQKQLTTLKDQRISKWISQSLSILPLYHLENRWNIAPEVIVCAFLLIVGLLSILVILELIFKRKPSSMDEIPPTRDFPTRNPEVTLDVDEEIAQSIKDKTEYLMRELEIKRPTIPGAGVANIRNSMRAKTATGRAKPVLPIKEI